LDETVKRNALHFIGSGRALQDWAALTEERDRSIAAREKVLAKAKAAILSAHLTMTASRCPGDRSRRQN